MINPTGDALKASAAQVRVKPLEWEGREGAPGHDVVAIPDPFHMYTVRHLAEGHFDVILNTDLGSLWFGSQRQQWHTNYAEAKAAAKSDYERRILAALSPGEQAPQPVVLPFVYGIMCPDGTAYLDEICVDSNDSQTLVEVIEEQELEGHKVVALYTYPAPTEAPPVKSQAAIWCGDEGVLPAGARIEVLAQDEADPNVPGRRASWVRYWPERRDYPVYRSCDECDFERAALAAEGSAE